ncbi:MAG: DNA-3-methyladenine glycosylase family protein [Bellilinea sp.]
MIVFRYGQAEIAYLCGQDRQLGQAIERIGRIERPIIPDMFTALISSIVHQQISNKAAATVWSRVVERLGPILPEAIAATAVEDIQQCGMSLRKAGYIKSIAQAIVSKELILPELNQLSDDEVIQKLSGLPGVGVWTAEMLMIFSMQRPDIVSWHDLAIRRGIMNLYGLSELKRSQFDEYRKHYSPYGSVASLYLWQISKEG